MTRLRIPPQSITQRMEQLTERAETLEQQLVQSQRLVTLGTLSMIMAHEVNNQLMTIINRADVALDIGEDDATRKSLEKIVSASENASSMIRNILGFAASASKERRRVKASQLMEDALGLMARPPSKDGIEVRRDFQDDVAVSVAPVELMQVILNLVINAGHAMTHSGGALTLRVYRQDGYAALEVCDTGCGIAEENLEQIFDPFFTTKGDDDLRGGSGLGLYISRKIVRDYGGDVSVVSRVGQGSTFTIYLPIDEGGEPESN